MADVRLIRLKFKDILWLDGKDGRKKNPRKEDMAAVEKLAGRIKEDPTFYDNRPSLVSFSGGKYYGYGGHKRALAATKVLKWPDIPCNVENDVPQPIMDKRAILDNLHDGEWDKDELLNFTTSVSLNLHLTLGQMKTRMGLERRIIPLRQRPKKTILKPLKSKG
jgi:hypothetical protein